MVFPIKWMILLFIGCINIVSCDKKSNSSDVRLLTQNDVSYWPNGIMPYLIDPSIPPSYSDLIHSAASEITNLTNVTVIVDSTHSFTSLV